MYIIINYLTLNQLYDLSFLDCFVQKNKKKRRRQEQVSNDRSLGTKSEPERNLKTIENTTNESDEKVSFFIQIEVSSQIPHCHYLCIAETYTFGI